MCRYDCNPHDCNCVCTNSVTNRQCAVACGQCSNPVVTFSYPGPQPGSTLFTARATSCGRDDTACVSGFFNAWRMNATYAGYYNPNNPASTWIGSAPSWSKPAGPIVGLVFLSLFLCGGLCCWPCACNACCAAAAQAKRDGDAEVGSKDAALQRQYEAELAEYRRRKDAYDAAALAYERELAEWRSAHEGPLPVGSAV